MHQVGESPRAAFPRRDRAGSALAISAARLPARWPEGLAVVWLGFMEQKPLLGLSVLVADRTCDLDDVFGRVGREWGG